MKNGLIKRCLTARVFKLGSIWRIWFGLCRGMKIRISPSMGRSVLKGYENRSQRFLRGKIRKGMTVYDIGASAGHYGLFFGAQVGSKGRVICFEPVPAVFEELIFNIRLNGLSHVTGYPYALGDRDGRETFQLDPDFQTMGKISRVEPTFKIPNPTDLLVEMRRLDSLKAILAPPDLLKIDTEGSAGLILEGAKEMIRLHKPRLFIEFHGPEERRSVSSVLKELGYVVQDMDGHPAEDMVLEKITPIWCFKRDE